MLCEHCGKNQAVVKFYQNHNGKKQTKYICNSCAEQMMGSYLSFENNNPFGMIHSVLGMGAPDYAADMVCPTCGTTYREFMHRGKFGCEDCYDTFGPKLKGIFGKLQAGTRHKSDASSVKPVMQDATEQDLQRELAAAVKSENYEKAAELKRRLDDMKKGA